MTLNQLARILIVDDNPGDIRLVREALGETHLNYHMDVVMNGEEALAYLNCEGQDQNPHTLLPNLILLDINLPGKNGFEILRRIKMDERWKFIPVIVVSSSQTEEDVMACYNLHANAFITKPIDYGRFAQVIAVLQAFWFQTANLPPDKSC